MIGVPRLVLEPGPAGYDQQHIALHRIVFCVEHSQEVAHREQEKKVREERKAEERRKMKEAGQFSDEDAELEADDDEEGQYRFKQSKDNWHEILSNS